MGNLHELQDRLASELQALRIRVAELEPVEREREECRSALRRAERRLRELNEGSIQGILIHRDFRILYANAAFAGMLGYGGAKELLGRDLLEELASSMPAERRRAFYEARLRGEPVPERYEVSRPRKDGSLMWMDMVVRVVDWEGAPAVQVACQDVTPYRRALEELRASEQRFRDFAEASSDWFWETDADHRFTWTSPRVAELLGRPADYLLGKTRRELGEADPDEEKWRRHEADLAEHRPFSRFTYSFRDAAGERHYASSSGKPIFDGEGRFLGYRGTARDVTGETQVRVDAERAHSRLRDAVESIPASFHLYDSDERFVLANSRAFEMFPEYRDQYVPGRQFRDLLRFAYEQKLIRGSSGRSEDWVETWLARFRNPPEFYEYQRHDGRWIRVYDRRTTEGGRVSIRFDITSQKEREEALRVSQGRFRGLIEGSNLPMLVHRDFKPLFVNQAYADLFGFASREVVLALPDIRGTFPPEELRRSEAMYADRMAGREAPPRFERRAIRADGSLIDLDVIATVLDWEGEPAALATFVDVTKRKQAEQALRESEARFRTLVEGSVQGILVHRDFKPLFSNQAFVDIFGFSSREAVLALPDITGTFEPELLEWSRKRNRDQLEGKQVPTLIERAAFRADGTRIWVETLPTVIDWEGGPAILVSYIDITERKRAEEALRQSEMHFRRLIGESRQAIVIHRALRPIFANDAYVQLFGFQSREQVLALEDITVTAPPEEVPRNKERHQTLSSGDPISHRVEREAIRRDGTRIWVDVLIAMIEWEGAPAALVTYVDITERKRAEEALRKSEERFRGLAEGSIEAIIVHRDFKPVFANRAFVEMFGYDSVEEVLALELRALPFHAPSERERVLGYIEARLRGEKAPVRYRFEGLRKEGTPIWAEVVASVVKWDGETAIIGTYTDITELVMAEEARRRSEDKYRNLLDGSIQGILVHRDHVPLFLNKAYANTFGYESAGEILALQSLETLLHPTERPRVRAIKNARMRGDPAPAQYEFQGLAKDGEVVWIDCINTVIEWDGQPAILSTQVDVTERKRAEQALRDSEERFRRLVENSLQGIVVVGESAVLFANRAEAEMFGFAAPGEMIGTSFNDRVSPEDLDRLIAYRRARLRGDPAEKRYEFRGIRKDGTPVWLEVLADVVLWEGQPAVQAMHLDITERKHAEEELRSSRELLQTVFDALPLWVSVKDRESRYLIVNRKRQLDTALSAEQYQGLHSLDLPYATREVLEETVRRDRWVMEHGQAIEAEYEMLLPDGRVRAHHSIKVPLRGPRGEVVGVVAVVEDVTERTMLEDQLRQAQKMEAIGQLAGGVAHDFNNLLQIISGYSQFALREIGDQSTSVRQDLQEVLEATERGSHLTRQLLTFGRRQMLRRAELNVNDAVLNLARMLKRLFEENIELVVVPGKDLAPVHADAGMIEQVLMNLCLNARDAMQAGGVLTITSESATLDRAFCDANPWAYPGQFVKVTVEDTGEGILPEHLERVFEPFFTTKELGKGTGLGLAMAYGIVRQHNGIIRAESRPGQGARFTVYLPVSSGAEAGAAGEPLLAPPGGRETILVAEDEPRVRDMAVRVLRQAGYVVLTAADGEEAIAALESRDSGVDLVVLDVIMPKKDGRAVFETIRGRMSDVPVLFCSGYSTGGLEETLAREKNVHMLHKPYKAEELLRDVRAVLDDARRESRKSRSASRGPHPL